jgi:hypothetical protein
MGAGDAYIAAIVVTMFVVAPFNALARVIVASWTVGHIAYRLGVPELEVNAVQHMAAFVIGSRFLRGSSCLFAYALLVPMLAIDGLRLMDALPPAEGWWWTLSLALVQLSILPFGIDRKQASALTAGGLGAYWAARPTDFLRVGA